MNIVLLIGRLTQDVEIRNVADNRSVATITIAVKRDFKNSDGLYETDFIPITLWEGLAQTCQEYCRKGTMISVKGRIDVNRWEAEDGKVNRKLEIVGEKISLLTSSNKESDQ